MKKILFYIIFLVCESSFAASLVPTSDDGWMMVGCDGKIYERPSKSGFKQSIQLPSNVKAKEIVIKKGREGVGTGASDDLIYVISDDGDLYVRARNESSFELSNTQLPAAAKTCKSADQGVGANSGSTNPRSTR